MGLDKTIERKAADLTNIGIPAHRAYAKVEGSEIGKLVAFVGALLCLVAGAAILLALWKNITVGVMLVAVLVLIGGLGLVLMFLGASLISREAEPIIATLGQWIINLIRAGRGKNGTPPAGN